MRALLLVMAFAVTVLCACGESKPPLVPDPDTQADGGAPASASAAPAGNPAP